MDYKHQQLVANTKTKVVSTPKTNIIAQKQQQQQQQIKQEKLLGQGKNENFNVPTPTVTRTSASSPTTATETETSPPSPPLSTKVTVRLPESAAQKLRELVLKQDIALLRLGIISVQFENDQIIPLSLNRISNESVQPKPQTPTSTSKATTIATPPEPIIESSLEACNTDYFGDLNTTLTTLFDLTSPDSPIFEETSMNAFESPILESSIGNGLPERLEI